MAFVVRWIWASGLHVKIAVAWMQPAFQVSSNKNRISRDKIFENLIVALVAGVMDGAFLHALNWIWKWVMSTLKKTHFGPSLFFYLL